MSDASFSPAVDRVPFAQIANAAMRDPRLSLKAKGLLALMLTFRAGWKYHISHLQGLSTDGREAHQSAMKELEAVGYVTRQPARDPETGKLSGWDFLVTDQPLNGSAVERESRQTVGPSDGKAAPKKTNDKKTNDKKKNTMSAHADTQVGGSSQEGQEGQGKKLPESQPTQAKRKARKASTAASTGEGSAAAARLVELWNEHRGTLGAVRLPMSDARLKLVSRVVDLNTAQGLTAEEAEARWVAAIKHVVAGGWYKKKGYGIDNLCRNFEANASAYDAGQGQGNTNPRRLDNARKYADDQ